MEKMQFKAESKRLMDMMINSIYTHKEIFLREIISNASDAIDKLAYTALTDNNVGLNRSDFEIRLTRDEKAGTLTISDNGIGMDRADMEENLGTIAKSGSLAFKKAMEKQEDIDIIGQFGVGFYSAFMVAEKITVISKKYGSDTAWKWTSDSDGYTIAPAEREMAGTDVILTLKADTEEEYDSFYREKFYDYQKPLAHIHVSAEGSVSYKALLYIPAKAPYDFYTKDFKSGLQLYSSGVMIMEHCEDLLPEHFRFVRGVVDSQDLSLNISRELLQHNRQLTIIARNLEKKIKGELKNLLENDRAKYEEFFGVFGRQLKYGTVANYGANKESCQDLLMFLSAKENKNVSLKEYAEAMAEGQEKIYYAAGENGERLKKLPQVETLLSKGYDVLLFTDDVDEFIPQTLMTYQEKKFCNALSEDLGLETEEEKEEAKKKAELLKGFLDFVSEKLSGSVKEVRLSRNLGSHPVALVPEEGMSFEMEKYMKRANPEFAFQVGRILELNEEHEAVKAMQLAIGTDPEKAENYAKLLYSQACLMADLPVEDPVEYTRLVCSLMK